MAASKIIAASSRAGYKREALLRGLGWENPLQSVTPQAFPEFPLTAVDFFHFLLYQHSQQWKQSLAPLPEVLGVWSAKHLTEHCAFLETVIRGQRPNPKVWRAGR